MKLLVDECLSEELARYARERGHFDASHVRWIGKGGAKMTDLPVRALLAAFDILGQKARALFRAVLFIEWI